MSDYVDVHVALGLGVRVGTAALVSPLGGFESLLWLSCGAFINIPIGNSKLDFEESIS